MKLSKKTFPSFVKNLIKEEHLNVIEEQISKTDFSGVDPKRIARASIKFLTMARALETVTRDVNAAHRSVGHLKTDVTNVPKEVLNVVSQERQELNEMTDVKEDLEAAKIALESMHRRYEQLGKLLDKIAHELQAELGA